MTILITLFVVAWTAASLIGTQVYFLGEQSKPIHERNLNSDNFEQLAQSVTGKSTDYASRVTPYALDAYLS